MDVDDKVKLVEAIGAVAQLQARIELDYVESDLISSELNLAQMRMRIDYRRNYEPILAPNRDQLKVVDNLMTYFEQNK